VPRADSPQIARRFLARARLITFAAVAGGVAVIAAGAVAMTATGGPRDGGLIAFGAGIATLVAVLGGLALIAGRRARALRVLRERFPGAVVVLSRRLPPVVSDLSQYLAASDLDVQIDDRWYATTVSDEGIGVWTTHADPQHLLTMTWDELGEVAAAPTTLPGGEGRFVVTVDVKPYVVPLTADLGYASGIVTAALDATDTAAVVEATNARRP